MKFLPKLTWKQPGGLAECPYFYRYILDFGPFAFRLHHWLADDDHRAYHDHPYWFWTFILKGGYDDMSLTPAEGFSFRETLRSGMSRYRPAEFRHSVQNVIPGTWTFLITGRPSRRWAFWIDGKKLMRDKYFAVWGHHPCDAADEPVRQKPSGERIDA